MAVTYQNVDRYRAGANNEYTNTSEYTIGSNLTVVESIWSEQGTIGSPIIVNENGDYIFGFKGNLISVSPDGTEN